MSDPRPTLLRRLIPWIMVVAYALVIVVSAGSVVTIRDTQRAQVVDQLETALSDQVAEWEDEQEGLE